MREVRLPDDELDRLVAKAVAASSTPLAAPAVRKALPAGLRPATPAIEASLERLATARQVHAWPKGKGWQWSARPFDDAVRAALAAALRAEPLPLARLKPALKSELGVAVPPEALAVALAALEQAGQAHRWPAGKAGAWSTRDFASDLEARVAAALEGGPRTETELQRALGRLPKGAVRRSLEALLASARAHSHPPRGKQGRYGIRPPAAADYVGPVLARAIEELRALGFVEAEVRAALAAHLGSAAQPTPPVDAGARILAAMVELNPKVREGDVVYVPHLRVAVAAEFRDKASFDRAMLGLLARDQITMQAHPAPTQLADAERDSMVPDGRGSYFMVAGLRR